MVLKFLESLLDPKGREIKNSLENVEMIETGLVNIVDDIGVVDPDAQVEPDIVFHEQGLEIRGQVIDGFALGEGDVTEIAAFEELNGGRTRWHHKVVGRIALCLTEEWPKERSGLIFGYVNDLGEKELVDMVWVDVGESGQTHPLPDSDLLSIKPEEFEIRQQLISDKYQELNDIYPGVQMQIMGWYHDHPPTNSSIEKLPTAPNPGTNDLKVNMQMQASFTNGERPLMVIGQKNNDFTISLALWRAQDPVGGKVIFQPGIILTEQREWDRYWHLPEGGQNTYDVDRLDVLDIP